jgi:membrane protease YdiL (CAAX protease family)
VIALIPAIGEELLFRGVIQGSIFKNTNIHVAVLLTSIIFSAFHLQFYGFLPRMVLGILLGYSLAWSGSLWLPVLIHFINNGAAVVFAWFSGLDQLPFNQDLIGTEPGDEWIIASSFVMTAGAMIIAFSKRKKPLEFENRLS